MSKDPIFTEPMRQIVITMSAWRRLAAKADELEIKDGKLILSVEGGYSQYGELDLAHYLKVTVIW